MPEPTLTRIIGNGLLFNLSWLAIVSSQSNLLAPLFAAAHLGLHAMFWSRDSREWAFIGGLALFGASLDQLLFAAGLFNVSGQPALAPLWLSCLWLPLATTFCHAFRGLQARPMFAGVLGAMGGALSYSAGIAMTNVEFGSATLGPVLIGLVWAVLFPLIAKVSQQVERPGEQHEQQVA